MFGQLVRRSAQCPCPGRSDAGLASGIMKNFRGFATRRSPNVPSQFNHPHYIDGGAGVWPMTDFQSESGESQAIVRYTQAMLAQLGVGGTIELKMVWAEPDRYDYPKESDLKLQDHSGLHKGRTGLDGMPEVAMLVHNLVVIGVPNTPHQIDKADGVAIPGLNAYKACLKLEADGETRYYPGGSYGASYSKRGEVLRKFWGLVWVQLLGGGSYLLKEVVGTY